VGNKKMVFGSRIRIVRYYYFFGKKRILDQNTLFIFCSKRYCVCVWWKRYSIWSGIHSKLVR